MQEFDMEVQRTDALGTSMVLQWCCNGVVMSGMTCAVLHAFGCIHFPRGREH